jgi:hypothetical protein
MFLTDHVIESLWPPFEVERLFWQGENDLRCCSESNIDRS